MVPKPSLAAELSRVAEAAGALLQLLICELVCLQPVDSAGLQVAATLELGVPPELLYLRSLDEEVTCTASSCVCTGMAQRREAQTEPKQLQSFQKWQTAMK